MWTHPVVLENTNNPSPLLSLIFKAMQCKQLSFFRLFPPCVTIVLTLHNFYEAPWVGSIHRLLNSWILLACLSCMSVCLDLFVCLYSMMRNSFCRLTNGLSWIAGCRCLYTGDQLMWTHPVVLENTNNPLSSPLLSLLFKELLTIALQQLNFFSFNFSHAYHLLYNYFFVFIRFKMIYLYL